MVHVYLVAVLLCISQLKLAQFSSDDESPAETITDGIEDTVTDVGLRGCECWRWPECSGNCTANPVLKNLLRSDHQLLATLTLPFVLVFPYQDRKLRSTYNTSTAGKRGTFFVATKFWVYLPNQRHVQLKLQKSRIFGPPNSYSTLSYQRRNDGQIYPFASNKLDHCFYTGTVREDSEKTETETFVTVDTCDGLRGLIHVNNQTFAIQPLVCDTCSPELLPHVIFPVLLQPIERDAHLPVFWQPTDVLSRKSRRLKKIDEQLYTIRLSVVLDHDLFGAFGRNLEQSIHYVGSVINQATKSFQGLPIDIRLVRSEIWNLDNHFALNSSIKITLNQLADYSIRRSRLNAGVGVGSENFSAQALSGVRHASTWPHRVFRRSAVTSTGTSITSDQFDVEVLFAGIQFDDVVEYLAVPDSICTPRSLAVIQVNISETAFHVARLLSLAIADVLGLKSFPCPPHYSCSASDLLSEGDKARIHLALFSGMADCLISTTPEEAAQLRSDSCGNGQLDRSEECDVNPSATGFRNRSTPCCNPLTCLADVGAVCTHGDCCSGCSFAPRGQLCRMASDQCDLPEFCTGTQPDCPSDLYLENGSPCRTRAAYSRPPRSHNPSTMDSTSIDETKALCYQGHCPTRESQCQLIWGKSAIKAADYCFVLHNTRTAGACGAHEDNCKPENAMCGLLHCQGGESRPVSVEAQLGQPFLTYTEHNGKQFECKHLSHSSAVRFVPEGAACSENHYCFQQQCVSPNIALRSRCPTGATSQQLRDGRTVYHNATCSNRGLCTNAGFCLCSPGWTGLACHVPATTSSRRGSPVGTTAPNRASSLVSSNQLAYPEPDIVTLIWTYMAQLSRSPVAGVTDVNQPQKNRMNSLYLAAILGSVVGGMFVFLAVFTFIYRRRGRSGYPGKASRSRCLLFSRSFGRGTPIESNKDNGALRLYPSCVEATDIKYTSLFSNPGHKDSAGSENLDRRERSYLDRWTHEGRSSTDRGCRRQGWYDNSHGDSAERHRERRRRDSRRKRRHGRLRREDDLNIRNSRRSAKHGDGGSVVERSGLLEANGANHSDTELAYRQHHYVDEDDNSIDRIIKFGSMPSYKEDKMRRVKRGKSGGSSHSLNTRAVPTDFQNTTCSSKPEAQISNNRQEKHPNDLRLGEVRQYDSAPSTGLISTVTSPLLTHSQSPFPTSDGSSVHAWVASCSSKAMPPSLAETATSVIEPYKSGTTLVISKFSSPASTIKPSDLNLQEGVSPDTAMENSWRQPEKGILKNKNEGGGITAGTNPNSSLIKNTGSRSSDRRHRGHHSHRHRHRRHRHSHSQHKHKDYIENSGGEFTDRHDDSPCSCYELEGGNLCRSATSDAKSDVSFQSPRSTSCTKDHPCRSEESHNLSGSSSASSRATNSISSQSSTSSSFSALDGEQDLLSSSSSSTTSTCSTALEVGPDGTVCRISRNSVVGSNNEKDSHRNRGRLEESSSRITIEGESTNRHSLGRHHRHHHERCSHYKKAPKQRRHRRDSNIESTIGSGNGTSSATAVSESSGSSPLGNTNGMSGLSGASSSSSGLVSHSGHHFHRRHRRLRTRRSTDEDATTSGSHHSSPMPPAPTILCNAGQQTDEMSLLKATGLTTRTYSEASGSKLVKRPSKREQDESDGDWEEVECSESACEECQATNKSKLNTHTNVHKQTNHSSSVTAEPTCSGHTNPAYLQSFRQNEDTNLSNSSILCQQQSTASSSLSSSKNSRIGTPATNFSPPPVTQTLLPTYPPPELPFIVGNPKVGITNRAASSSSCSSSSVAGHQMGAFSRPRGVPGNTMNSDELMGQHSETEVDAHLHLRSVGAFHPKSANPGINAIPHHHPPGVVSPVGTVATTAYSLVPTAKMLHRQHPVKREAYPMAKTGPVHGSPNSRSYLLPANPIVSSHQVVPSDNADNYYQHPYEDVATDDYAEATNGRSLAIPQHIYHQHGSTLQDTSSNPSPNGCTYVKGDEDEDERLSLDEGHSGVVSLVPSLNGFTESNFLTDHFDIPASKFRYPPIHNPGTTHLKPWIHSTPTEYRRADQLVPTIHPLRSDTFSAQMDPTDRVNEAKSLSLFNPEDGGSEFSISAFRRDDIQLPYHMRPVSTSANCRSQRLNPRQPGSSEHGTDVHSNDGTCDESDASSLPEAGCDLVQLAQLDMPGRPNSLLNDLARQQASNGRWMPGQHYEAGQWGRHDTTTN